MSEGSGAPASHSPNIFRNILVGVTTTVLGSSAIYFLGFNHRSAGSSGNDYLVVKDATIKAWKSYVTIENIYTKNSISLMKELQETKKLDDFEENIIQESKKFETDLEQLIKDQKIDGDFISMIKRRLQNENIAIPKTKNYLGNIRSIVNSNFSQAEKSEKLAAEDQSWATYSKGTSERAITDVEDLAKILSERYAQPFAMTDLIIYKMLKDKAANTDTTTTRNNINPNPDPANGSINQNTDNVSNINNPVNTRINPDKNNSNNTVNNTISVNKSMLTGDWSTNGAEIYLSQDGTMEWEVLSNGDNAYGTWNLYNNQLYMYATGSKTGQKSTWVFNLTNVSGNSFTMTLNVQPYNSYSLVRMKDH